MYHHVRLSIAAAISTIIGWLSIALGNNLYALTTGTQPPTNSDFTIINWTISLIISGLIFILAYIKITNWLGE